MADEPNKRMDEMLKAYADKRRQDAGAPSELHPATRQMLQAEVARTYRQTARASWLGRLITFWPRIAFAGACVVITLTLVLIVLPRRTVTEMAQTAVPVAPPVGDSRVADKEQAEVALADTFNYAPAPTSSTAPMASARSLDRLAKQNEADDLKRKPESEVILESRKDADAVRLMREEVALKEVGRQSYADTGISSRARYTQQKLDAQLGARVQTENVQPILNNFEFEQTGNQVRIIDEDGSIYSGNTVSQDEAKKRFYRLQKNAPAERSAAGPAPVEQALYFRAAGTNRSLKQQVSIEANIVQLQTNVVPGLKPVTGGLNQNQRSAAQNAIRGRALVGTNQQELLIEALPRQP